jgi:hypothetical protein
MPVEIQDLAHPPKLDANELVDCPENERYFKLWPAAGQKASTTNDGGDSAIKELTNLLKIALTDKPKNEQDDITRTLVNWALTQKDKEREESSPSSIASLITALKGLFPSQPAPPPPLPTSQPDTLEIIKHIRDLQPDPLAVMQQAKELFTPAEPAQPAPTDDFARFERFLSVADRLAGWRGGGGRRSGWEVGLDFARELGPTVVQPVLQLINNVMVLKSQASGALRGTAPASAPAPAAFDPYANPEMLKQHARAVNAQPAASPSQEPTMAGTASQPAAPAAGAPPQPPNELAGLIQAYGGLILNHLNAGTPGYVFADWITGLLGTATHVQITAQGEPALLAALLAEPQISFYGEERLKTFVHEFIHYQEYQEEEEEEEPEPIEVPVAKAAPAIDTSKVYRPGRGGRSL